MEITKLRKSDIRKALDLVWTVFQEFEAPDFSKQGIEEFKNFISYNSIIEKFENKELCFWGYWHNNDLIGVIATRGFNHICMLFVDKKYHKQGIAKKLFKTVAEGCKKKRDIKNITLNASPYAVEVYHHLGFIDTDNEQTMEGIRFTPMLYLLR